MKVFFDVIYDSDDDKYYAQVYNRQGQDIETTGSFMNPESVKRNILQKYPDAMFIKLLV